MKIWAIVSDFPKVTETFALANVQAFRRAGHLADVFHIKPFRTQEVVHPEAREVVDSAFHMPYLARRTLGLAARAVVRRPWAAMRVVQQIIGAFWKSPRHLGVSLMLVPQGLALGARARDEQVDHLYAEFAGYPATVAWVAARVSGIPFSFSAHAHDIFITQGLLAAKARDAAFVRTISDFNRRFLIERAHVPMDKIRVIRCGVAPDRMLSAPPNPPEGSAPIEVLFVGALLPRKGVDVLLRAMGFLPKTLNWHLRIIGAGPQREALGVLAAKLPEGRVSFEGAQTSDVVQAAMAAAHLVVVPSVEGARGRSEGIPVVLIEALAQARPVVASRLSGIPELVQDGVTGTLVPPGEAQALSTAIGRVMHDFAPACALARAGQARVQASYDITKNAAELLARIEGSCR